MTVQLVIFLFCVIILMSYAKTESKSKGTNFFLSIQSSLREAEIATVDILLQYEQRYPLIRKYLLVERDGFSTDAVTTAASTETESKVEPLYNIPTLSPSIGADDYWDQYCLTANIGSYSSNISISQQCKNCINAACSWCKSSEYCFNPNAYGSDDCSVVVDSTSLCSSVDLAKLAMVIIIIIIVVTVVPVLCCIGAGIMVCMGGGCMMLFKHDKSPKQGDTVPATNPLYTDTRGSMPVVGAPQPVQAQAQYGTPATYADGSPVVYGVVVGQPVPAIQLQPMAGSKV